MRLIPAHAGKTSSDSSSARSEKAHPRSRGENIGPIISQVGDVGSSPLTRGKLKVIPDVGVVVRLIPAHAGKTRRFVGLGVRGMGSSPLTRGKRRRLVGCPARAGLIPAHAGKTCASSRARSAAAAHPRSRGENWTMARRSRPAPWLIPAHAGKTASDNPAPQPPWAHPRSRGENDRGGARTRGRLGSSPLTRGKQDVKVGRGRSAGLIPAHAGKTKEETR